VGTTAGTGATDTIVIPEAASAVVTGDTPEWEAALREHHTRLVKAGVDTWAAEGKKLTARRAPRKNTARTTTSMSEAV
jgi:hypothetical protein